VDIKYLNNTCHQQGNMSFNINTAFMMPNTTDEIEITITTKELTAETLPTTALSIPINITMDWIESEASNMCVE